MLAFLGASAFCVFFDRVYALFGHGVFSAAMTLMFLYPLIGGAGAYLLLGLLDPSAGTGPRDRLWFNLYNSGIATLTVGNALQGVFVIAGTTSPYVPFFWIVGTLLAVVGAAGYAGDRVIRKRTGASGGA